MFSSFQRFGVSVEKWVCSQLCSFGWTAVLLADFQAGYDILVDDFLPVEVKASRPGRHRAGGCWRDRWQFDCTRGLDPFAEEFLYVFVAVDWEGELFPYFVPSFWVAGRAVPALTSHPAKYSGWLSPFLRDFSQVGDVLAVRRKYHGVRSGQLSLF